MDLSKRGLGYGLLRDNIKHTPKPLWIGVLRHSLKYNYIGKAPRIISIVVCEGLISKFYS